MSRFILAFSLIYPMYIGLGSMAMLAVAVIVPVDADIGQIALRILAKCTLFAVALTAIIALWTPITTQRLRNMVGAALTGWIRTLVAFVIIVLVMIPIVLLSTGDDVRKFWYVASACTFVNCITWLLSAFSLIQTTEDSNHG